MPATVTTDHERHQVHFVVSGALRTQEMIDVLRDAFESVAGRGGYDVLSDQTEVLEPLTSAQLGALVGALDRLDSPFRGRRAAMVVARAASYGMMRMLAARTEPLGLEVRVFWNRAEAEEWLDSRAEEG